MPPSPKPKAIKWVSDGLEGSSSTIQTKSKLPGRNPEKDLKGTDSSEGTLEFEFSPLALDDYLAAVLCGDWVKNDILSDASANVFELVPGVKQRSFYLLKEYTQTPINYQLFTGLQFASLSLGFSLSSVVKTSFKVMGASNNKAVTVSPVSLADKVAMDNTTPYKTLDGFIKFNGTAHIGCTDLTLEINNNMKSLEGLFQKQAIEKSLGMLDITGSITEYINDFALYNRAKDAESGTLSVQLGDSGTTYRIDLNITFDNSQISGDEELSASLPFKTYGTDRCKITRTVPV